MDRIVHCGVRLLLPAGSLRPFFFGSWARHAVGFASERSAASSRLAADRWRGALGHRGFGGREGSASPSCLPAGSAQQCVQAERASPVGLT